MATFVEALAWQHLGGDLAQDAYEALRSIEDEPPEMQGWIRRIFEGMERGREPRSHSLCDCAVTVRLRTQACMRGWPVLQ